LNAEKKTFDGNGVPELSFSRAGLNCTAGSKYHNHGELLPAMLPVYASSYQGGTDPADCGTFWGGDYRHFDSRFTLATVP